MGLQDADRECKNYLTAHRVYDFSDRTDGLVDYIMPQSLARLSTEEEILKATDAENAVNALMQSGHRAAVIGQLDQKTAGITIKSGGL